MAEPPWPIIFAVLVAVPEFIMVVALVLQRSRIGSKVPDALAGIYDAQEYEASMQYTKEKADLSLLHQLFDFIVFFAFWFLKGFPALLGLCERLGWNDIATGLVFFAAMGLLQFVLDLPWSIYRTFWLEAKYDFNRTTAWTFVKDILKSGVLGVVIGAPMGAVVLWFFMATGSYGWLWVWLTITVVQLVLLFLTPVLLLPLFYEMIPLPAGTALLTGEAKKGEGVPEFLCERVFYSTDTTRSDGTPTWATRDRRFEGAARGAELSIVPSAGSAGWAMAEGAPPADDSAPSRVYATGSDPRSTRGAASEWPLTSEAKSLITRTDGEREQLLARDALSITHVNVDSLRDRLLALATRLGYVGANIFVIDGSTRSVHSNAFCVGFGRFRRICLYDTLLRDLEESEIIAILGHEIGHDRLYHTHNRLVIIIAYLFVMLFLMGKFITSEVISSAFFVDTPKVYVGLVLFGVVWGVVDFVFSIPVTVLSRKQEYDADRYSVDADESHAALLGTGLIKLMKKSKTNLTPHPFYVFLTFSHPPLDARLDALKEYQSRRYKAA